MRSSPLVIARRLAPLATWTTCDQVLFALSNLVVTIAIARGGGAEALGRYALAFAIYIAALGFARSFVCEPMLTVPGDRDRGSATDRAATLSVVAGVCAALPIAAAGAVLARSEIVVVGLALPFTLAQDLFRYAAFRARRPALAALVDGCWVLVSLASWPVIVSTGSSLVAALCWSAGGVVGCLAGVVALRYRPVRLTEAWGWWTRECRAIARPLIVDSALVVVSAQGVIFLLAILAGDSSVGFLRASQVLFAPLSLALTAASLMLVPHLAGQASRASLRVAVAISVVLATGIAALCLLLVGARGLVNGLLFDGSIHVGIDLLIPAALLVVFTAASVGFVVLAKATQRGRKLVQSRAASAAVGIAVFCWASSAYGVLGASWALTGQAAWYAVHLTVSSVLENRRGSAPKLSDTHV